LYIGQDDERLEPEEHWAKPMTPEMQFALTETYGFGPPWKEKYPVEIDYPFMHPKQEPVKNESEGKAIHGHIGQGEPGSIIDLPFREIWPMEGRPPEGEFVPLDQLPYASVGDVEEVVGPDGQPVDGLGIWIDPRRYFSPGQTAPGGLPGFIAPYQIPYYVEFEGPTTPGKKALKGPFSSWREAERYVETQQALVSGQGYYQIVDAKGLPVDLREHYGPGI